jgi:thiamine-monophosphate kinase
MKINDIGEFELIERLARLLPHPGKRVVVGIGDDCAVYDTGGDKYSLVTTDMLIENIHFSRDYATPFQIGWRAMACNISDIASMGGTPTVAVISLGVSMETEVEWIEDVYKGMKSITEKCKFDIVGGDTVTSPHIVINIALLGEVSVGNLSLRSNAQIGDLILVTGDFGGSDAGLKALQKNIQLDESTYKYITERHLLPEPRLIAGEIFGAQPYHRAMTDSSDGLAADLRNISIASSVGILVHTDKIPIHPATIQAAEKLNLSPLHLALYGGEDYELVFTAPKEHGLKLVKQIKQESGVDVTIIGEVISFDKGILLVDKNNEETQLTEFGYEHFKKI